MKRKKTYKCDCDEAGYIKIDPSLSSLTCGIIGLIDSDNCRIIKGKAYCHNCGDIIYEEKEI